MAEKNGLNKSSTGIAGIDEMTWGGLPRGRTVLLYGGPGTGKTTLSLQILVNGIKTYDEPGIFVAFEETAEQISSNFSNFKWDLSKLQQEKLFILHFRPNLEEITIGDFDLSGLLAALSSKVREIGAKRIVFDSVDVLLTNLREDNTRRRELYRLREWLSAEQLMGIITSKFSEESHFHQMGQDNDFLQYLADVAIRLEHQIQEHVSQRRLRILKYRGSAIYENPSPYVIGSRGIDVACTPTFRDDYPVYTEKMSSGIEQLDVMLNGGYIRGSSVLISGFPGTAKSTLAGAFVEAGFQKGEKALYVSFDEGGAEVIRNLRSVAVDLEPHVQAGLLKFHSARSETRSAEEHRLLLESDLDEFQPDRLVIDHISALLKAGPRSTALAVAQRIIYLAKRRGITLICTSLIDGEDALQETTQMEISTIADAWIHLSYIVQAGERNRALTIIKARGTAHSNQVRELILSDSGITLTDVYTSGGEVLMGTLRWEKQQQVALARAKANSEIDQQIDLVRAEVERTSSQIQTLHELAAVRKRELEALQQHREEQQAEWLMTTDELRRLRSGDLSTGTDMES